MKDWTATHTNPPTKRLEHDQMHKDDVTLSMLLTPVQVQKHVQNKQYNPPAED